MVSAPRAGSGVVNGGVDHYTLKVTQEMLISSEAKKRPESFKLEF